MSGVYYKGPERPGDPLVIAHEVDVYGWHATVQTVSEEETANFARRFMTEVYCATGPTRDAAISFAMGDWLKAKEAREREDALVALSGEEPERRRWW